MNHDKANLVYPVHGKPQWKVTTECTRPFCKKTFLSIREGQRLDDLGSDAADTLVDRGSSQGPLSGFLSAMHRVPRTSFWLHSYGNPSKSFRFLLSS